MQLMQYNNKKHINHNVKAIKDDYNYTVSQKTWLLFILA